MSEISLEEWEKKFYNNLERMIFFIEQVIEKLNKNGIKTLNNEQISLVKAFLPTIPKEKIINTFINKSYSSEINNFILWDKINEKDEDFFINNSNEIFSGIVNNDLFHHFFKNDCINQNEKNAIWKFLNQFIMISIRYCKITGSHDISNYEKMFSNKK